VDMHFLRLDQTDVELAGQAFDIDFLYTDAYEIRLLSGDRGWCDQLEAEVWYNRTVLEGDAQRAGKRATFPFYDAIEYVGFTDVDSMSTGVRAAATWGDEDEGAVTAGADFRYLKQELNEISSGDFFGGLIFTDANSPIPKSHWSNPGVFVEAAAPAGDSLVVRAGGRADWVSSNIDADEADLQMLGIVDQAPASDILGTTEFDRDEALGLGYVSIDGTASDTWNPGVSVGYAERAPNLTERYAIQPFMFLLQNGLNTVTGDPLLDKERALQVDLRATQQGDYARSQVRVFQLWVEDYITFKNDGIVPGLAPGEVAQEQLQYINARLATFWGAEALSEIDLTDGVTAFSNLKYVQATNQSRDEPLPSILPLESTMGLRIGDRGRRQRWGLEMLARAVAQQSRVAASLLESVTPGFTTWTLRSFYRPNQALTLTAGVENFTDKAFREHLDFRSFDGGIQILQPGANFYASGELSY
jgi:iron complex outermembrane recepter protein